jgi:hypothetical protein
MLINYHFGQPHCPCLPPCPPKGGFILDIYQSFVYLRGSCIINENKYFQDKYVLWSEFQYTKSCRYFKKKYDPGRSSPMEKAQINLV